MKKNPVFS